MLAIVVIPESVLSLNIGGAEVMHEQLTYLAERAESRNIIVNVIPASARVCAGLTSNFIIADYVDSKGDDRTAVYLDNAMNGEVTADRDTVRRQRHTFEVLRAGALSQDDSLELIKRKAQEWKS